MFHFGRNDECAVGIDLLQAFDEFPTEYLGHGLDRKKEFPFVFRLHPLIVNGESTAGHYEMKMEMIPELAAPGVEDAEKTDLGAEMLGVTTELQECFRCRIKEKIVNFLPIVFSDRQELVRQGKNNMIIGNQQQVGQPGLDPLAPGYSLAFGAMTVATGVVGMFFMPAGGADIDMVTKFPLCGIARCHASPTVALQSIDEFSGNDPRKPGKYRQPPVVVVMIFPLLAVGSKSTPRVEQGTRQFS